MSIRNNVFLIGRLTKKPDITRTEKDKIIASFSLAVNNSSNDTDFIPIKAFGKNAEICEKYLEKGDQITIQGILRIDNYEKDDVKKSFPYVIANSIVLPILKSDKKKEIQNDPQ